MFCPKCERDVPEDRWNKSKRRCKDCWAAYMRNYYQQPGVREKWQARNQKWKDANREQHLALMKQWRQEHPEQFKATRDRWAKEHRDRDRELHRLWREAHPERWKEILALANAEYERRNPYARREIARRRRARMVANGHEPIDYAAILDRDGLICYLCRLAIDLSAEYPANLHFEHVIPLAKGGPHTAENIRPAHGGCNLRKGVRLIYE